MTTLLITGGAGFIGSNFTRLCASTWDASVVVLDALTYAGNIANIQDVLDSKSVTFVHGDIRDADLVRDVFVRHDIVQVAHFAAESHVDRSILGPRSFVETNVVGTLNLLLAARDHWRGKGSRNRFLHVSTDEVYQPVDEVGCG